MQLLYVYVHIDLVHTRVQLCMYKTFSIQRCFLSPTPI